MFQSYVCSYKGFLNGLFFTVHGNSRLGFSGFDNLYSTDARTTLPKASDPSEQKPMVTSSQKLKSDSGPIITLIGTDNNPSVVTFRHQKNNKTRFTRRAHKDSCLRHKNTETYYQLMTGVQYYTEGRKLQKEKSAKKGNGFKGDKLVTLSHRIPPHDLSSKLKNVTRWLSKTYEVRVVMNGDSDNMKCAEQVYDMIAEGVKTEGRVVQKGQKEVTCIFRYKHCHIRRGGGKCVLIRAFLMRHEDVTVHPLLVSSMSGMMQWYSALLALEGN
jgi:translation initiation factor IF-3